MNKRKYNKIPNKTFEKKPQGKDYRFFLELAKESSKLGPISFVIVDDFDHRFPVRIEYKRPITINGIERDDGQVLDFIAKIPQEFKGLFLQVMKKYDPTQSFMPKFYIANLTDLSGLYGKPAIVDIHDGTGPKKFKIERTGPNANYYIGTKMITKEEAEKYVEAHYGNFLVGMRKAVKDMKGHKHIQNKFPATLKEANKKAVKHSEFVDGKLQVDIDSFLPRKKPLANGDKIMTKGDQIMQTNKRGYIED